MLMMQMQIQDLELCEKVESQETNFYYWGTETFIGEQQKVTRLREKKQ
jgi:hypothetical protein